MRRQTIYKGLKPLLFIFGMPWTCLFFLFFLYAMTIRELEKRLDSLKIIWALINPVENDFLRQLAFPK